MRRLLAILLGALFMSGCRLNDLNPQAWLADVLNRIGKGHPINRIDELLPWNWCLRHHDHIDGEDSILRSN